MQFLHDVRFQEPPDIQFHDRRDAVARTRRIYTAALQLFGSPDGKTDDSCPVWSFDIGDVELRVYRTAPDLYESIGDFKARLAFADRHRPGVTASIHGGSDHPELVVSTCVRKFIATLMYAPED